MSTKTSICAQSIYRFFLGGRDLEMLEIARLLDEAGLGERIVDCGPAWGARASLYSDNIRAAIDNGETPVLIELVDDLPTSIERRRLVQIDHHGISAGVDRPSSLRQIFDLVAPSSMVVWNRYRALIEANDIGHIVAMRALEASPEEICKIRDADRAAQGITPDIEIESRRAISNARYLGSLLIAETTAPTSSAVVDFLMPEYGGPGAEHVLVITSGSVAFFGAGSVVSALCSRPNCWYGGALPERGFWGAARVDVDLCELSKTIATLLSSELIS